MPVSGDTQPTTNSYSTTTSAMMPIATLHHQHQHHHQQVNHGHYVITPPHGAATTPSNQASAYATHSVLEITQQPPDSWYKDQFGRKATFDVSVKRIARGCGGCADMRHLNVHLLYESGKPVENQNILRVATGLCLNKDDQSVLAIRIMEVSKNHQNQRFRVQISLPPCPLKLPTAGVAGAISEPVLVLSKKNKRPVKPDTDDPLNKNVVKLKKSKCAASPNGSTQDMSPTTSTFNTPTNGSLRTQPPPPEFAGLGDSMAEDDQWGAEMIRFREPSQGLCLWANAAFNFMHRLQWQNRIDGPPSPDGSSATTEFQCPECHATYGSRPVHRSDCDLALLLEQTGSIDDTHDNENTEKPNSNKMAPEKTQSSYQRASTADNFAVKSAARPSLAQAQDSNSDLRMKRAIDAAPTATSFGSTSVDLLAKNLNLGSWEGYSSLSKIMFSLEAGLKQPVDMAEPLLRLAGKESRASDASMNSLSSLNSLGGGSGWSFGGAPAQPTTQLSLNLSSLLSSVKGLSPDTAAFLQEQEAELTGDASLLRSLSKVSLSEFLPDGGGADRSPTGSGLDDVCLAVALQTPPLSATTNDSSSSHATESAVMAIASVDFHNCGLPAFDASYALVGSYFVSEKKKTPELRFLPNLYPLPAQMLRELEADVVVWRQAPNDLLHTRHDTSAQSLAQLKAQVVRAVGKVKQDGDAESI